MPYSELLDYAAILGIEENAFWAMQPAAFKRKLKAHEHEQKQLAKLEERRQDAALYRAAWIASTIMNFSGKQLPRGRKVKPEDLLRKKKTAEELKGMRQALIKRFKLTERFGIK